MRGDDQQQSAMFSYVTLEQRIPADHPLRRIRVLVDRALAKMDRVFDELYSQTGRPSLAPERLMRAQLLMILYSIRSERQLRNWLIDSERSDPGMAVSQKKCKLVEKVFGWMKQDRLRQIKLRGLGKVDWLFQLAAAAHNLLRMSKLIPIQAQA
jgi:hypothetical protein